ncbi:MAG: DUF1015 domain-containing protein [Pseudomonadota bacterium]
MARILPFQGIHYNPNKIESFADVTAPPYDVIPETRRDEYHDRHPYNVIRLILGQPTESDTPDNNPHTRAARAYREWLSKNILIKAPAPALYLTAIDFPFRNETIRRYGLFAKVGLEPFDRKIILPHETTFSKVKSERLDLMKRCNANFSPIFSLYTDPGNILSTLVAAAAKTPAEMDFMDDSAHRHQMWRFTDPALHQFVTQAFSEKKLFIADGHHRYETAINYRNWLKETRPDFNGTHPANFIMMSLVSMSDPGLVILPAHRILSSIPEATRNAFLSRAEIYFDISTLPGGPESVSEMMSRLSSTALPHQLGVVIKEYQTFFLLGLKPGVMDTLFGKELPPALRHLDVTVLTRLILMELLGVDQQQLDDEKTIAYASKETEAIDAVITGGYDMSFILRPTKIEQVRQVSEEGLIMPRKSTYFYPKVLTGQVLNDLLP